MLESVLIVFWETAAEKIEDPRTIPVTVLPPDRLLMVFPVTVVIDGDAPKFKFNAVMGLVPPVQLEKVLPWTVLVGAPPSVLLQPAIVVAPVTVMFEKLLLLLFTMTPATELPLSVWSVTVLPAPVLL